MRDLDRDTGSDQAVQQPDRILDGQVEAFRECRGGEERHGRHQIDSGSGMGIASPSRDGGTPFEPRPLEIRQKLSAIESFGRERVQEHRLPGREFEWRLGPQRGGPGERDGHPQNTVTRPEGVRHRTWRDRRQDRLACLTR
jgi:hypothetical protein